MTGGLGARIGVACLLCLLGAVQAQPAMATDEPSERDRLSRQRQAVESRYTQEVEQCYQRFAVNDCKQQAIERQRESLKKIREQEQALDAAQRAEKARSHQERLAARQSPASQEDAAQRRAQAVQKQRNAEQKNLEKNQSHEQLSSTPDTAFLQRDKRRPSPAQEQAYAQDHARKLEDAQAHRAANAQRRLERTKPRAEPLPVPDEFTKGSRL